MQTSWKKKPLGGNFARRILMDSRPEIPWNPAARLDTSVDGIISPSCMRGFYSSPHLQITRNVFSLLLCVSTHLVCCRQVELAAPKKILHLMMQVWAKQHQDWLIRSLIPVVVHLSRSNSEIFLPFFKKKWSKLNFFFHTRSRAASAVGCCTSCLVNCWNVWEQNLSSLIILVQSDWLMDQQRNNEAVEGRLALHVQVHMHICVCMYCCCC